MADEDKTEEATPRKRQDERKKGNIFQSKDITTAIFIFVSFFALKLLFPYMYRTLSQCMVNSSYVDFADLIHLYDDECSYYDVSNQNAFFAGKFKIQVF